MQVDFSREINHQRSERILGKISNTTVFKF